MSALQSPSPGLDRAEQSKMECLTEVGVTSWVNVSDYRKGISHPFLLGLCLSLFTSFFLCTLHCNADVKTSKFSFQCSDSCPLLSLLLYWFYHLLICPKLNNFFISYLTLTTLFLNLSREQESDVLHS